MLLRVLSGEWTVPEAVQHITRQGRDGTAQGDLTVSLPAGNEVEAPSSAGTNGGEDTVREPAGIHNERC